MPGWNDPSETIVGGGGQVYVAAPGAALPTKTSDALAPAAWTGLGFHTEDGVSINQSIDIQEYMAWQSKSSIRREQNSREFQFAYSLLQWNESTLPLAMGGGAVTEPTVGQFKYAPPLDTAALEERSMIVDVDDGARRARFIIPRGTVTDTAEVGFKRGEMSPLAVTFKALTPLEGGLPWYVLFNDAAAFAPGS